MYYPIKKTWIVIIHTPNDQKICAFKTRYLAYNLFNNIKETIKTKYPEEPTLIYNEYGSKGNAYYGLIDKHYDVRLISRPFVAYTDYIVKEFKEEIENEI